MVRTFISLDIPEAAVERIKATQEKLKRDRLFNGHFVLPEQLHVTLKFLGDIREDRVEDVRERLRQVKIKKFKATVNEIGLFDPRFIRVIWVKLDSPEVIRLQKDIDQALLDLFPKEEKYISHVTIARVKHVADKDTLIKAIEKFKIEPFDCEITGFSFQKSTLQPGGPVYEVIEKYK